MLPVAFKGYSYLLKVMFRGPSLAGSEIKLILLDEQLTYIKLNCFTSTYLHEKYALLR